MFVIGTAGHVDHGKSTLVEALTGIDPDRLKEERERQMTIDLGFAWLTLPNGQPVGIVDVPGHRDFIENMLAGVGGIDAALFVIAADEGVMPQTREHLAILDLLKIPAGIIVLTKTDLVDDEWLGLVRSDVAALVADTVLSSAPIVPVSARTGAGMDILRQTLQTVLAHRPPRPDTGQPFLPIDRVFTLAGFGTVVTGTLAAGQLAVGDDVHIQPGAVSARVRGLQMHKAQRSVAVPGSRVAVNLTGVDANRLSRGQVLLHPGGPQPTKYLDVRLEHLANASLDLRHNAAIKLFVGAAEVMGRVRLLDADQLAPGAAGWAQLLLDAPVVVQKGQRFILRRPSPAETIAGGAIVDPYPPRRHRRFQAVVLSHLETLARGTPSELLLQALDTLGPARMEDAARLVGLELAVSQAAQTSLEAEGQLVSLDEGLITSRANWNRLANSLTDILAQYHSAQPLRAGMPREELKSRLGAGLSGPRQERWTPRVFNALVTKAARSDLIVASGALVSLVAHRVTFSTDQQIKVDALLAEFRREPYTTPAPKDCAARVGDGVLAALIDQGVLVPVSADVLFLADTYTQMVELVRTHIGEQGAISVAAARDLFGTSRKYVLALLEHLDARGVTRRVGDERVLRA